MRSGDQHVTRKQGEEKECRGQIDDGGEPCAPRSEARRVLLRTLRTGVHSALGETDTDCPTPPAPTPLPNPAT